MHYIALLCLNSPNLTSPRDSRRPSTTGGSAEQSHSASIGIPALQISSVFALIALANLRSPKIL